MFPYSDIFCIVRNCSLTIIPITLSLVSFSLSHLAAISDYRIATSDEDSPSFTLADQNLCHTKKWKSHKTALSSYYVCLSLDLLLLPSTEDTHTLTHQHSQIKQFQETSHEWAAWGIDLFLWYLELLRSYVFAQLQLYFCKLQWHCISIHSSKIFSLNWSHSCKLATVPRL